MTEMILAAVEFEAAITESWSRFRNRVLVLVRKMKCFQS